MRYVSTRGQAPELGFADVLLAGLATDGGLYVPVEWPAAARPRRPRLYADVAAAVMQPVRRRRARRRASLERLCADAYATFRHPAVVPLVQIDHRAWLLELFHGPTLAFKDVALQLVGRMFDHVLAQRGERITIVGATSGDTGSAAIDGVKGCANVDIVILYPDGRTSDVQRRQMTTVDAPNVHAVAIEGTFDDCQDLVKAMFADAAFRDELRLSAVNSINWARVMAQIVYYVTASRALAGAEHDVRADRQLRQRAVGLDRPPDGRADRRLRDRLERQRHPHPLRQRRRHDAHARSCRRSARAWTSRCRRTSSGCCSRSTGATGG